MATPSPATRSRVVRGLEFGRWTMCALFLVIAQFVYQALNGQLWDTAIERSYFQVMALAFAYWTVGPATLATKDAA